MGEKVLREGRGGGGGGGGRRKGEEEGGGGRGRRKGEEEGGGGRGRRKGEEEGGGGRGEEVGGRRRRRRRRVGRKERQMRIWGGGSVNVTNSVLLSKFNFIFPRNSHPTKCIIACLVCYFSFGGEGQAM